MGFGTLGDLNAYRGSQRPTGLPQWLLDQFSGNTTVDEGGGQKTEYSLNNNPYGGFQRDGKYYVQVGQNKLKDPSKVSTDPELGDITEVGNINDPLLPNEKQGMFMLAALATAGLLGPVLGIGAEAAGGAAGAAGAGGLSTIDTGLAGLFTGAPELAPALAHGGWQAALAGAGSFGPEAGGLLSTAGAGSGGLQTLHTGLSGLFTGSPELAPATANYAASGAFGGAGGGGGLLSTNGAPVTDLSTTAETKPWYQSLLQGAAKDPLNAARTIAGLYSMGQGLLGGTHAGANVTGSSGGPVADASGVQQYNPLGSAGQFQQNPYLLQAMQRVPFMSRG